MNKINILHLITELEPGGAEYLLLNTIKNLSKGSYSIIVCYIYGSGTLAKYFRAVGIKVIDLSYNTKINPLAIFKLYALLRKEKIEILHTHLLHASILGRVIGKLAGIRIIITTQHCAYHPKHNKLIGWLDKITASLNTKFIAISEAVKTYLVEKRGYAQQKIVVIHNAVNIEMFNTSKTSGYKNRFIIGSVGNLIPQKGYDTLILSIQEVVNKYPHVKLSIIGEGKLRMKIEKLIIELRLSDNISLLGAKSQNEIADFLKGIDLFVLASYWEGFGLVVAEAMASGKSVVATDVEGLKEIIDDGETGLLVPPREPTLLAQKIIYMIENRELARRMGLKAREKVEQKFSLKVMVDKLDKLYQELLKK